VATATAEVEAAWERIYRADASTSSRSTAHSSPPGRELARRVELSVSFADRHLSIAVDNILLEGAVTRQRPTAP